METNEDKVSTRSPFKSNGEAAAVSSPHSSKPDQPRAAENKGKKCCLNIF